MERKTQIQQNVWMSLDLICIIFLNWLYKKKINHFVETIDAKRIRSYLFPSLPLDWATPAGAIAFVFAGAVPRGWDLVPVFAAGVPVASPLWAESSESYSSSLLLDDVRK